MILQPFKPEVEAFVQQELESGRYTNLNDLLEQAIALLHKRSHHENWIETMRETVDGAIAELDRGEGIDGEQVIAELYDRLYQKAETIES